MSEQTSKPTIFEALAAVMGDVQAVRKGDRNKEQGYDFRGIDAVVNAVGPALRAHGVIAVPHHAEARYRDVQTKNGKPSRECTVTATYRFYGPAGDFIEATVPGESMDFGDKGAAKAMSVAYRIALLQALCIPTDDPEPDASTYERAAAPEPETDWDWANGFETRVTAATTLDALRSLFAEMTAMHKRGRLTSADRPTFERLITLRKNELEGSPA